MMRRKPADHQNACTYALSFLIADGKGPAAAGTQALAFPAGGTVF